MFLSVRCHLLLILHLQDHTQLHPVTSTQSKSLLNKRSTTTGRIAEARTKEVSLVSKYLALPSVAASMKLPSAASSRVITGARVLTSTRCLAILKEKEEKKNKEEEKKEERSRIKEAKKKQREEEKQRKLEQKALKEQEKRRKDAEKEEGCRKRRIEEEERGTRAQQIATQTEKRGRNDCGIYDHETITRMRSTLRSRQDGTGPSRSKAPRLHRYHNR